MCCVVVTRIGVVSFLFTCSQQVASEHVFELLKASSKPSLRQRSRTHWRHTRMRKRSEGGPGEQEKWERRRKRKPSPGLDREVERNHCWSGTTHLTPGEDRGPCTGGRETSRNPVSFGNMYGNGIVWLKRREIKIKMLPVSSASRHLSVSCSPSPASGKAKVWKEERRGKMEEAGRRKVAE